MDDALEETETSANDTIVKEQIGAKPIGRIVPKTIVATLPSMANAGAAVEVPCYRERLDEIHSRLEQNRSLALLYVDATNLAAVEHDYGAAIYDQVRAILTNLVLDMRGVETRQDDLVTVSESYGDTFLIFLSKKREERLSATVTSRRWRTASMNI